MYKEAACPLELILWDLMTSEKNKRSKYHFDSRGEHYNLQQVPDPANTGNASDHYWTLEKRIRQDKKNPGVLIEIRKSTAIQDIAYLVGDGVITMDELEGFGEELIDAVKLILQHSKKNTAHS